MTSEISSYAGLGSRYDLTVLRFIEIVLGRITKLNWTLLSETSAISPLISTVVFRMAPFGTTECIVVPLVILT